MNRNRNKQKLPLEKGSNTRKKQKSASEKVSNSQKKQKLSVEKKNNNPEENLSERITRLEEELADKGFQLNLTNVLNKEEQNVIRKLQPEVEEMLAQIQNEKDKLIMEKIQLENSLREKEMLLFKTQAIEHRLITAKSKLDTISNEIVKTNDAARNINSLPDEIMLKIFGHMKQNKFGQIARVCKRWKALTKSPALWKIVDVELYDSEKTEAVKKFVQKLPSCVSCIKLDLKDVYWSWVEETDSDSDYDRDDKLLYFRGLCLKLKKKCPHLQMLTLHNAQISDSLLSVIDFCTQFLQNVRRLGFYNSRFVDWPIIEEYSGNSKIETLDIVKCNFKDFSIPPLSKMPCLKVLNLHRTDVNEFLFEDDTLLLNQLEVLNLGYTRIERYSIFQTILSHAVNLNELYLCDINPSGCDLNFNNLEFPHLKTICLSSRFRVTCKDVISVIQSCQSLENVYVNDNVAKSYAEHPFVLINRCKLEIVKSNNSCDYH